MEVWSLILNILLWFGLYVIVSLSLNVEYGYCGIPNFGKALSVIIGAVVVGGIVTRILMVAMGVHGDIVVGSSAVSGEINNIVQSNPAYGIALFVLCLLLAMIIGTIVGALFILPSARLKEDYLAITLLAIAETFTMVCYYNPAIVGSYYGVSVPNLFAFVPSSMRYSFLVGVVLLLALLVYVILNRIVNTPYGRLLKAVRENEDVMKAYGRNVMVIRIKTMALGSGIASIAGVLLTFYTLRVQPDSFLNYGRTFWTFFPFLIILLGGAGNNRGVVLGAFIFATLWELVDFYKGNIVSALHLPVEAVWLEYILFGVLMLLILFYKPEGLIPEKPIMTEPIKRKAKKLKS